MFQNLKHKADFFELKFQQKKFLNSKLYFDIITHQDCSNAIKCYSCANYKRVLNDLSYSKTCSFPVDSDKASACSGTYCFVSILTKAKSMHKIKN